MNTCMLLCWTASGIVCPAIVHKLTGFSSAFAKEIQIAWMKMVWMRKHLSFHGLVVFWISLSEWSIVVCCVWIPLRSTAEWLYFHSVLFLPLLLRTSNKSMSSTSTSLTYHQVDVCSGAWQSLFYCFEVLEFVQETLKIHIILWLNVCCKGKCNNDLTEIYWTHSHVLILSLMSKRVALMIFMIIFWIKMSRKIERVHVKN